MSGIFTYSKRLLYVFIKQYLNKNINKAHMRKCRVQIRCALDGIGPTYLLCICLFSIVFFFLFKSERLSHLYNSSICYKHFSFISFSYQ